jgi:Zn-dependent peptidase ImmA (M78 family)
VQGNSLERLSNYVAAETLLPREEFFVEWDSADALDTKLRVAARRFRVSALVVLRRALDLGRLTAETYWAQFQRLSERQVTRTSHGEGGDFYATLFARASRTFTTAVSIAVAEGRVLHRDAARLLNVRVATLDGIQERVLSGASPLA